MHPAVFIAECEQFILNIQRQYTHIEQSQQYDLKAPLLAKIKLKLAEINKIEAVIRNKSDDVQKYLIPETVRRIKEMAGYLRELDALCVNLNQFLLQIPTIPITMPLMREEPESTPIESTRSGRSVHFGDKQQREQSQGCRPLSRQQSKQRDSSRSRSRSSIRKKSNGACPICPIFGEDVSGKELTFHHLVDPLQQQLTMNKFQMHRAVFIAMCKQFALNIQWQCTHIEQWQQYHFKAPLLANIKLKLTEINKIEAVIQNIIDVQKHLNHKTDESVRYIAGMEGYLRELNAQCDNLKQFLPQQIPIIGIPITMPNSTPIESTRSGRSTHSGDKQAKQQREQSKRSRPLIRQQSKARDPPRAILHSRIRKKSNGVCPICPIFGEDADEKELTFHHLVPLSAQDWFKRKHPKDPLVTNDKLDEHGIYICRKCHDKVHEFADKDQEGITMIEDEEEIKSLPQLGNHNLAENYRDEPNLMVMMSRMREAEKIQEAIQCQIDRLKVEHVGGEVRIKTNEEEKKITVCSFNKKNAHGTRHELWLKTEDILTDIVISDKLIDRLNEILLDENPRINIERRKAVKAKIYIYRLYDEGKVPPPSYMDLK